MIHEFEKNLTKSNQNDILVSSMFKKMSNKQVVVAAPVIQTVVLKPETTIVAAPTLITKV
jgi:hypothetical protein